MGPKLTVKEVGIPVPVLVRRRVEFYTCVCSQTSRNQYGHPNSASPDSYNQRERDGVTLESTS